MRVTRVELQNFRAFEQEAFAFHEQFTVLIGDNGTGKSAILDGLALGLGASLQRLVGRPPRVADADVRLQRFGRSSAAHAEPQYPVGIDLRGEIEDLSFRNAHRHFAPPEGSVDEEDTSTPLVNDMVHAVRAGEDRTIPVIVAYATQRMSSGSKRQPTKKTRSRLDGYASALTAGADAQAFTDWLRQRTGQSLEAGARPDDLGAVLSAVEHALPDWNGVRFDFTEDALLAIRVRKGQETDRLPFRLLSDGQRAVLGLMCDLAYRCVVLNPHLGAGAVRGTPGVALIDEIDLHLHPRWQRTVVDDLRRAFPQVQFIATTHSPFIIQALPARAVINLSNPMAHTPGAPVNEPETTDFRRESIEDIAEREMGVANPQWSEKRQKWWRAAEEYYRLVQQGIAPEAPEVLTAKQQLDEASVPFADDTGFAVFRALESRRRSGDAAS